MKKILVLYAIASGAGGRLLIGIGRPELGLPIIVAIAFGLFLCAAFEVDL